MALLEDTGDRINFVDRTVSKLHDRVEAIHGDWRHLMDSNREINQRIESVDKELTSVIQILNRLESHVIGDKGKGIASSPSLLKKIEVPVFDGSMPYGWIARVERYFRAARYDEQQKLEIISLSLIGAVGNCMFCQMLGGKAPSENRPYRSNASGYQNTDKAKTQDGGKTTSAVARPRLHLSPQELAEYKQLKLCFQCKAKWFKGHICGKPELQVYTVIEGIKVEVVNDYEEEVTEIQEPQESQLMQLSLYTFLEMDSPTTMKGAWYAMAEEVGQM
ncbi:hypothetical protein YC2023_002940 [Brassica napus]